jgi:hypothetical protein
MNLVMKMAGNFVNVGKKQLKAIWLLAPYIKAGDIENQGLVMKALKPIVVAVPPGHSIKWKHPTKNIIQTIEFDGSGYEMSVPNLVIPPIEAVPRMKDTDRMAFSGGTWYSLDNLPPLAAKKPEPITIEQLPPEMQVMAQMNQAMFTGEGKTESPTDRFQSLLTNALAKALHGDKAAIEAIEHANQLFELGQKTQAVEALAQYA